MNWTLAIERKTRELTDIVILLGNMVALCAHRLDILWILTPAESAVRRLVWLVMTHQLKGESTLPKARVLTPDDKRKLAQLTKADGRTPCFPLIDPRKSFDDRGWQSAGAIPRIWTLGMERYVKPVRHDPGYEPLQRRIDAMVAVLENLTQQAVRMRRLVAKRTWSEEHPSDAQDFATKKKLLPLRPGLPPGWRQPEKRRWRGGREVQTSRIYRHEIDAILHDCQTLIHSVEHPPPFVFTGWATQAPRKA